MDQFIRYPDIFSYLCQFVGNKDMVNFLKAYNPSCSALILLNQHQKETEKIEAIEKSEGIVKCELMNCPSIQFICTCGEVEYISYDLPEYIYDDYGCHDCDNFICDDCTLTCSHCTHGGWCKTCALGVKTCPSCETTECEYENVTLSFQKCPNCEKTICNYCKAKCRFCNKNKCSNDECCIKCNECSGVFNHKYIHYFALDIVCDYCFDEVYSECSYCNEIYNSDDIYRCRECGASLCKDHINDCGCS